VARGGLTFIGPPAEAIERMGSKLEARATAIRLGVPVVPGSAVVPDLASAQVAAATIGYPVMLKAAAGGGGKGMRAVGSAEELERALPLTRGEAASAFGDDRIYLEKLIERAHHIEIQVLCDTHGGAIALGERDCSLQRRHQKVIEETPSPFTDDATRTAMAGAALAIARAAGYVNAGTVEFIVDEARRFYFLEMNTRLQVEHPVTEMVTGIDLVKEQIAIAEGKPLGLEQDKVHPRGAAIECRICAEDPARDFLPAVGKISRLRLPSGPGIRNDAGIYPGLEVSIFYDPLLAKLIAWGRNRDEARRRLDRALAEYEIEGVRTNLPFHRWVVHHPRFKSGEFDTRFIADEWMSEVKGRDDDEEVAMIAAAVQALEDRRRTATAPAAPGPGNGQSRWRFRSRAPREEIWRGR
jgi:acetyl-CoA carboxylase biotin carboxylase subunit